MANNSDGRMAGVANAFALEKGKGHREGSRNVYKNQAAATKAASLSTFSLPSLFNAPAAAVNVGAGVLADAYNKWLDSWLSPRAA